MTAPPMARQLPLDLGHRPALGRDDFLVAGSNREAVGWIDRWPDWPAPALVVHGPRGAGKTHLARVWRARSGAAVVEGRALSPDVPAAFADAPRACLVVEGADAVRDAEALLHLYNVAAERGGWLLLTAAGPPARWRIPLADLDSRLRAAPAVAIGPPEDELLEAVLVKLFADRQLRVGPEVISYLVARMERSLAAARGLVAALDARALAARRGITVPLARAVLEELAGN